MKEHGGMKKKLATFVTVTCSISKVEGSLWVEPGERAPYFRSSNMMCQGAIRVGGSRRKSNRAVACLTLNRKVVFF